MSSTTARAAWYRPDVDGLRAVAVVLVVGYHADWPGFGAGLVGVDVFLVISGFVITAMLLREYDATGTVAWSTFYARRVRRLLPAAALMVVVVVALAALMSPAWSDPWTVPLAGVAALTSTANFHYWWIWRDGLSPGALGVSEPTPLLHTWTLSMEEQFYLVLPLVAFATLWLVRGLVTRGRTTPRAALLVATVLLGVGSFVLTLSVAGGSSPGTLYLLPFRAFEFCIGVAIALLARPVRSLVQRSLLAVAGIAALALMLAIPDRFGDYPGYAVLLPCLGAAALILARPALLALPPLVHLGTLSYGWYLWHLPAIELARAWNLGPISPTVVTVLAVGSLLLAALSHHLLERPIRRRADRAVPTLAAAVAGVLVLSMAGAGMAAGASAQAPDYLQPPADCRVHPADRMPRTGGRCDVTPFDSRRPTVVLRGDSHAWQMLPAVLDRAREQDYNVVAWVYPDCPPIELTDDRAWKFISGYARDSADWNRWADCLVVNQFAAKDVSELAAAGGVATIAAARWSTYLSGADARVARMLERGAGGLVDRAAAEPVVLVAPVPELASSGSSCATRLWRVTACDLDRATADASVEQGTAWLRGIADDVVPVIDLTPELCGAEVCGVASYLDPTHLDARRVARLGPTFDAAFELLDQ